ncbi:response regulator [Roseateles chitosanitabidus]|jgi:CheY-like chemotaxis protein|uniref:response regulator n=1 Tax=Roseateles chitosanitabidus TaxID=65048 RepID=UPI0008343505|nr:response regulator [Roseateles chitosanitabidus]MBO9686655.1 response regulator [Roseateles chitosanitabidus]
MSPDRLQALLVEDHADSLEFLTALLDAWGCEVRGCSSAQDALDLLDTWAPQVLITDINMPGMDGRELARRVRSAHGQQVVIVAVSGEGFNRGPQRDDDEFFDHYFAKPIDLDGLGKLLGVDTR